MITRRDPIFVTLMALLTCGIYAIWWLYVTTDELRRATGRADLNPALDLVLVLVTCGIWGLWVEYRNVRIVHEVLAARGVAHEDRSQLVLILNVLVFVVYFSGFVASFITQEEYNRLGEALG